MVLYKLKTKKYLEVTLMVNNTQNMAPIMQKLKEVGIVMDQYKIAMEQYKIAIEEYKIENPNIDIEAILFEQKEFLPVLGQLQNRELDKFAAYAKNQGIKMPFEAIEMGVLNAGRKDMQSVLSEITDSLKFETPICPECEEQMENRGLSKKKIITSVGEIEIHSTRYACEADEGQSAYPLQDFIGLIDHEALLSDGATENQTIKCTRGAAASIALACANSSYEHAKLMLNQLAGLDLNIMTEFRVTDSVGSEFVKETPVDIDAQRISEIAENINGNILEIQVNQMDHADNKDEIIKRAIEDRPDGVLYKNYIGPTMKAMYIMCDGTGVPGRRQELVGVKGKQSDGSAKTFEAKIGSIFIVEYTLGGKPLLTKDGEIYRNKIVKYMGTVRKVDEFGPMLYQHALENGLEDMDAVVFLGDGAKWIWGIQNKYFPSALTLIDLYHSIEKLNSLIELLEFKEWLDSDKKQTFKDECIELLRYGKIQAMLKLIGTISCKKGNEEKLESAMGYFSSNEERMNYGVFTALGIFVGSGVIEAGVKVIVGNRMKNAGMHWSKDHAEKMIALRCAIQNDEFLDSYSYDHSSLDRLAA